MYKNKYLKYKTKYLKLKNSIGGSVDNISEKVVDNISEKVVDNISEKVVDNISEKVVDNLESPSGRKNLLDFLREDNSLFQSIRKETLKKIKNYNCTSSNKNTNEIEKLCKQLFQFLKDIGKYDPGKYDPGRQTPASPQTDSQPAPDRQPASPRQTASPQTDSQPAPRQPAPAS